MTDSLPILSGGIKILGGGMRQDNAEAFVSTTILPDLVHPQGVHGTTQMDNTLDGEAITAAIRDRFRNLENVPRMSLGGEIRFITHDNGDGTMEVNFEVVP